MHGNEQRQPPGTRIADAHAMTILCICAIVIVNCRSQLVMIAAMDATQVQAESRLNIQWFSVPAVTRFCQWRMLISATHDSS